MHTYFTFIICPSTRQHFGCRSLLFDFYVDVIRISKEIKLHSNVITAAVMSKLSVTGFLSRGLPLLYLNRFEPHACEKGGSLWRTSSSVPSTCLLRLKESEIILTT